MPRVSTYLNFKGRTESAFTFYKAILGTAYDGPITRISEVPTPPGKTRTDEENRRIAHMSLPILGGHVLRGTDIPEVLEGNNVSIMLEPGDRAEAARLFAALSSEGKVVVPLEDMFWGAYFGQLVDRFGVQWFVNVDANEAGGK